MTAFWVLDLAALVAVGRISDRWQLRKPISVVGTAAAAAVTGYLVILMGRPAVPAAHLMVTGALLGTALAVAYGPWMANFSENAEDVDPRLQGTAWGAYGFLSRAIAVVALFAVPRVVEESGWQTWLTVSLVCLLLYIPASLFFRGPWRRRSGAAATGLEPAAVGNVE
jgi:OPA family glycerol-3-phosphate transporter-like MFS transporter